MFYSYDLSAFGAELRKIRLKNGYSQADVKEFSGVNEDTLRRIENGTVIPKYETLEILSSTYKADLLQLLQTYKRNKHFYNYYKLLDLILAYNDMHLLEKLIYDFKKSLQDENYQSIMISYNEVKQFEIFLQCIKDYSLSSIKYSGATVEKIIESLKLTIKDFSLDKFSQLNYNLLEIRILFLLGIMVEKSDDCKKSIEILKYVLDYLSDNSECDEDVQKIIIKCYCNIAYNYHRIDDDRSALEYANKGIDYCIEKSNMHCLYFLYARKGIAEQYLKDPNYKDSLIKSIHLLEINKQFDLSNLYKETFKKKYDIIL